MLAFFRLLKIIHVLAFYHIDELVKPLPHSYIIRLPLLLLPSWWLFFLSPQRKVKLEERVRLSLISLGPIFIKLGQLMATRRDLIGDELANELEQLTENVPPFDTGTALNIVQKELKENFQTAFKDIDEKPLASASIAQVHAAELKSGEKVVLKIIRPGIEKVVTRDVELMAFLAARVEKWIPETRLLYLNELVANYKEVIFGEMNLYREAANTIKMRKHALQHNYLYIPRVYLELSTRNVMCMERIYGIPVNQADAIQEQGTDLKKLAENGVKIFFTQVFKDNFFHADMHPGNIFVNTVNPEANQYVSVDCAISGSLSRQDQIFLAQQLVALLQKNYMKNAQLFIDAGWVTKDIHKEELALRLQKIVEPIFDQAISDIDFTPILLELLTMAREFHIHVNPNFLLFQKTLIHIEGLGKQLYPELNVWEVGRPLLEEWIRELLSPKYVLNSLRDIAPDLVQQLPEIPALIYKALNQLQGEEQLHNQHAWLQAIEQVEKKRSGENRALVASVLLIAGAGLSASGATLASMGTAPLILSALGFSLLVWQFIKK